MGRLLPLLVVVLLAASAAEDQGATGHVQWWQNPLGMCACSWCWQISGEELYGIICVFVLDFVLLFFLYFASGLVAFFQCPASLLMDPWVLSKSLLETNGN